MKKTFLLLIGFALICNTKLFSQETLKGNFRLGSTWARTTVHPLVLVDGFETNMESMVLSPDHIEAITILKDKSATEKYGEKARDGAILIETKPGTEFYKMADFVDISKNLNASVTKVELNGKLLADMNKLMIEKTALTSTMISADLKIDSNCNPTSIDTLVINTRFADNKQ